jgi:hypothetical protein
MNRAQDPQARVVGWIWLGPVAFLVHDAEEIVTVVPWLHAHREQLPAFLRPLATIDTGQCAAAVAVLFAGYVLAAWHGAWAVRRGRRPLPFLVVTGALVANALTHILQALYFGGYTPGVVTALSVTLPYGYAAGRALRHHGVASAASLRWAVAAGLVLQVPLVLLALLAGRSWG